MERRYQRYCRGADHGHDDDDRRQSQIDGAVQSQDAVDRFGLARHRPDGFGGSCLDLVVPRRLDPTAAASPESAISTRLQSLASSTMLKGVSAARRTRLKPPSMMTFLRRASPACAPSARPTSCASEAGVQIDRKS